MIRNCFKNTSKTPSSRPRSLVNSPSPLARSLQQKLKTKISHFINLSKLNKIDPEKFKLDQASKKSTLHLGGEHSSWGGSVESLDVSKEFMNGSALASSPVFKRAEKVLKQSKDKIIFQNMSLFRGYQNFLEKQKEDGEMAHKLEEKKENLKSGFMMLHMKEAPTFVKYVQTLTHEQKNEIINQKKDFPIEQAKVRLKVLEYGGDAFMGKKRRKSVNRVKRKKVKIQRSSKSTRKLSKFKKMNQLKDNSKQPHRKSHSIAGIKPGKNKANFKLNLKKVRGFQGINIRSSVPLTAMGKFKTTESLSQKDIEIKIRPFPSHRDVSNHNSQYQGGQILSPKFTSMTDGQIPKSKSQHRRNNSLSQLFKKKKISGASFKSAVKTSPQISSRILSRILTPNFIDLHNRRYSSKSTCQSNRVVKSKSFREFTIQTDPMIMKRPKFGVDLNFGSEQNESTPYLQLAKPKFLEFSPKPLKMPENKPKTPISPISQPNNHQNNEPKMQIMGNSPLISRISSSKNGESRNYAKDLERIITLSRQNLTLKSQENAIEEPYNNQKFTKPTQHITIQDLDNGYRMGNAYRTKYTHKKSQLARKRSRQLFYQY